MMDLPPVVRNCLAIIAFAMVVRGGRIPPQGDIKRLTFETHPQLKKQARILAATCDCNRQGSWKPVFKPSFSDHHFHGLHHGFRDDSKEAIVHKLKAHGFDLGAEDPTVNNHLIHLHLIPHIYVPIMHPVSYQVHETPEEHANDINVSSEESRPTPATSHEEQNNASGSASYEDTSPQSQPQTENNDQFYTIPPEAYHVHEDHIQHYHHVYDPTNSLDTSAFNIPTDKNHHLVVSPTATVHQYEVHEDPSKDNFVSVNPSQYNNIPSGSNAAPQLYQPIQPLLYINKKPFLRIPVPALPKSRSRYMRKLMSRQDIERLKVLKPPTLGQKQTWSMPPRPKLPPPPPPLMKLPPTIKISSSMPQTNRYSFAHRPKVVYYVNIKKRSDRKKK